MNNKILKTDMVDWKLLKLLQPTEMKKISKNQLEKLKTSFKKNGFKSPFYVWENKKDIWCLDGHTRIPILKLLEEEGEVIPKMLPANFIECKNKQEAKKSILIYNSHYASIQPDILSQFISDLNIEELNSEIDIVGIDFNKIFDNQESNELDAEAQISIADELAKKWNIETGQIWELGEHRIACGNSADENLVSKLLNKEKPTCLFTDPPYGVSIGDKNKLLNSINQGKSIEKNIENDCLSPEALKNVLQPIFELSKKYMSEECTYFVCSPQGGELGMMMMMIMKDSGLTPRHILIWKKNSPTFSMGRLDYDYQHEPIILTWVKKHKRPMMGTMKTSVWEVNKPRANKEHPTMKPVELYINAYLNNSDKNDVVYEPFSGSGTAIIAAENTGRKCRAIEIDPGYVAVAIQRWADATGNEPRLING